jgi:hypothetical protein
VIRLFAALVISMKVWMLVDAYRRRSETYWLWIIVGVPGGSLAYFFMVKMRDPGLQRIQHKVVSSLARPPEVELLRRRFQESPSFANRVVLAQRLGDLGHWAEAKAHFEALLDERPEEADALFGLGVSELALGASERAIPPLERLTELSPLYRDCAAYPELAEALYREDRIDDCLTMLRKFARSHPRLPHVVLLARYLQKAGKAGEAADELRRALDQHADAPRYVKRNNRAWARNAKQMLSELRA